MGYGEVGGDGSVQVSVHMRYPRDPETDEGPPGRVHRDADTRNQRSDRARGNAGVGSPGRAYRGQDAQQAGFDTDDPRNVFEVTIHFSRQADLDAAIAALNAINPLRAGGAEATFPLKVIRRPGQVHVRWDDDRPNAQK
jgi:hypothetical protein